MKRKTYSEIKSMAKNRMSKRFSDALIIVVVPYLLARAVNWIIGKVTTVLPDTMEFYADQFISISLTIAATFITTKLLLQYLRGKDGIDFEDFFRFDHRFAKFYIFQLVLTLIMMLPNILFAGGWAEIATDLNNISDPVAIQEYFADNAIRIAELTTGLFISGAISIVLLLLSIRIQFTEYIIIDKDLPVMEAVKKSWDITRGNFFRVLFFPLSFILWIFVVLFTCGLGIFYVAPYITVALGFLYFQLMAENGEDNDMIDEPFVEYKDGLEGDEKPVEKKEQDPFNDYYL